MGNEHDTSTVKEVMKQLSPPAKALLEILSFYGSFHIEMCWFTIMPTEMAPKNFPSTMAASDEAIKELLDSSLVKNADPWYMRQLSMHPDVQDTVRKTMSEDHLRECFANAVSLIWIRWPSAMPATSWKNVEEQPKMSNTRLMIKYWPDHAALYPHVEELKRIYVKTLKERWDKISDVSSIAKLQFAVLLNEAVW